MYIFRGGVYQGSGARGGAKPSTIIVFGARGDMPPMMILLGTWGG